MKYLVYHSRDIMDMVTRLEKPIKRINLKNYDLVAMVASESLNDVFRITNHINKPWFENREVIKCYKKTRSTSIGDVIVEFESHKAFMIKTVGMDEVDLV